MSDPEVHAPETLRDLTTELVLSGRHWRKLVREATAHHGVAEAGTAPLIWLGRSGEEMRQNALAALCGIESASLVRIIDDLAAAGLVSRVPDPADRRANLLRLTETGRAVVGAIEADLNALRRRVLGDIGGADLEATRRVLQRIRQAG